MRALVRTLGGMIGADSLSHSVEGVSRRRGAELKTDELRLIERERRDAARHVEVLVPDLIRGFDVAALLGPPGRGATLAATRR